MSSPALILALAVLVGGRGIDARPQAPRHAPPALRAHRTAVPDLPSNQSARPSPAPVHGRTWAVGTASWGDGWPGVVTRLPRGTRICVAGPIGSWCGRSTGYGPAAYTHRVADLSRAAFRLVCGDPSIGLCRVRVTLP